MNLDAKNKNLHYSPKTIWTEKSQTGFEVCENFGSLPDEGQIYSQSFNCNNLPVLATSNDVREVVRFLMDKTKGLSIAESLNFEPKRVFESRKMFAYEYWGITKRLGEKILLTDLGNKLAEIITLEATIFCELLKQTPLYYEALKVIFSEKKKMITQLEITEIWNKISEDVSFDFSNNKSLEGVASSFFSLCQSAGLGIFTIGKRGQPARLKVDSDALRKFIEFSKSSKIEMEKIFVSETIKTETLLKINRVFVSRKTNLETKNNLHLALQLADFQVVTLGDDSTDNQVLSLHIQLMKSCQAGIIIIGEEDCYFNCENETEIKQNCLNELILARAIFDESFIGIWDSVLPIPKYLQQLNLRIIEGTTEEFTICYEAVKTLKLINQKLCEENTQ